jgi:Ca-activated chloride channel family protein
VADASLITPPVLSPRMLGERILNPVSINIELDAGLPLAALRSPTHDIRITAETDHRYRIEFESGQAPANRDFELVWSPAAADAPQAAVLHQDVDGERYALLMLMPTAAQTPSARLPRETIFVIDTSGSMDGTSIVQARQALLLALKGLMPQDRFNVIEFNSTTHRLFANAVPATPHRLVHAAAWVSRLHAQGGTEMADALRAALNNSDDPRVLRQVIFLTDGSVGNEEQLFSLIRERLGDSRLFTIGIGSAPNSYFMSKAAQTGRGTFTYIGNVDEVAQKMGALFSKLEAPVLKNIHIDWPAGAEVWPQRMPDLYQGEPLFVSAKLEAAIDSVTLAGERNGQLWQARVKLRESGTAQGIDKLWARKKIEALMDGLHEGAAPDAVRQSVERVALAHGLVSKYTSLVAVELKPARPASEVLHSGAVPTHLPDGWVEASVFGELPQTATAANWHLLLASIGSIVAGLLWLSTRRRRAIAEAAA